MWIARLGWHFHVPCHWQPKNNCVVVSISIQVENEQLQDLSRTHSRTLDITWFVVFWGSQRLKGAEFSGVTGHLPFSLLSNYINQSLLFALWPLCGFLTPWTTLNYSNLVSSDAYHNFRVFWPDSPLCLKLQVLSPLLHWVSPVVFVVSSCWWFYRLRAMKFWILWYFGYLYHSFSLSQNTLIDDSSFETSIF